MTVDQEFLEHLHDALRHLYEPDRLRKSPLAGLFDVANRVDTFSALQRALTDAIEGLEPEAGEPPQSAAWEIYEPLFYRYVQQLNQREVAKQLGMSVRHLRRKEHVALKVLASHLWQQFNLETERRGDVEEEPAATQDSPSVAEELAWIKDAPVESPADLNQVLPELLDLVDPLAGQYDVELSVAIADDLPSLAVHRTALSQTLLNLLSVAIRQAPGGRVLVCAHVSPPEITVEIGSTRPSSRPKSDDDAASLDQARQLADLCGSRLTLSEENGNAFNAILAVPALGQLPVLVIDDNADTLQMLRRFVVGSRYRLVTSQDPGQALELATKFSPQIIVLDVMMPQIDGWRLLARLRQHSPIQQVPIVVCTILAQKELALSLGASGFIRKPITRRRFLSALEQQVALLHRDRSPE